MSQYTIKAILSNANKLSAENTLFIVESKVFSTKTMMNAKIRAARRTVTGAGLHRCRRGGVRSAAGRAPWPRCIGRAPGSRPLSTWYVQAPSSRESAASSAAAWNGDTAAPGGPQRQVGLSTNATGAEQAGQHRRRRGGLAGMPGRVAWERWRTMTGSQSVHGPADVGPGPDGVEGVLGMQMAMKASGLRQRGQGEDLQGPLGGEAQFAHSWLPMPSQWRPACRSSGVVGPSRARSGVVPR